jgi:hypothetical protein
MARNLRMGSIRSQFRDAGIANNSLPQAYRPLIFDALAGNMSCRLELARAA